MSEKTTILELMETYNKLLERHKKAREWDNDSKISIKEKHQYADSLASLTNTMIVVANQIKEQGHEILQSEYSEGFKQPEEFKKLGGKL